MADENKLNDLISKYNQLCELLQSMKLNPLANFEDLQMDDFDDFDDTLFDNSEDEKDKESLEEL